MNSYSGYKNRRSTSQVLPRVFLLLQVFIMLLLSYISYKILTTIGIPQNFIYVTLLLGNLYFLSKLFFKCKNIAKRNNFGRGYRT